jgi:hypothetical protein
MSRGRAVGVTAAAAVILVTLASGGVAQAAGRSPSPLRVAAKTAGALGTFGPSSTAVDVIPSVCTLDSYAPNKIVLGASKVSKTFSVKVSDCTLDRWVVFVGPFLDENGLNSKVGLAGNYSYEDVDTDGNPVTITLHPTITLSPRILSNYWAGKSEQGVLAAAWGEEDPPSTVDTPVQPAQAALPLTLLRRASFGSSFDAAPGSVAKGKKISLTGKLTRINWNGAKKLKYVGWAGKAQVQFKADGESKFVTVKTVTATSKGKISTKVTPTATGSWRLFFPGLKTTAPATSGSDVVKVS